MTGTFLSPLRQEKLASELHLSGYKESDFLPRDVRRMCAGVPVRVCESEREMISVVGQF